MATIFSKRVIAYILDFIIVSLFMGILSYFTFVIVGPSNVYSIYQYSVYFVAILIFAYFVLCEKIAGASMGKAIMNIEVRSRNGYQITWPQAIVRNLTKILWVPIIFDWFIGKLLKTDRLLNNITHTIVVKTEW